MSFDASLGTDAVQGTQHSFFGNLIVGHVLFRYGHEMFPGHHAAVKIEEQPLYVGGACVQGSLAPAILVGASPKIWMRASVEACRMFASFAWRAMNLLSAAVANQVELRMAEEGFTFFADLLKARLLDTAHTEG